MNTSFRMFLTLLLFGCSVQAQPPKSMGSSDPEAKKILDAVSAKFKTFKSVQSKFTLKIENSSNKVMGTKSGTVYMKGTKYRINVTGQEIFCDGSNVWTVDKAAKEITINKLDPSNNTITPQKLFTNFYDKDFLYKLNSDAKGVQEIELTPKVPSQDINANPLIPTKEKVKATQSATSAAFQPTAPAALPPTYTTPPPPPPSTSVPGSTAVPTPSASVTTVDPVPTHTAVPSPTSW